MSWPRWCTDQQKQPEQPRSSPETQSSSGTAQRRREKPRRAQEKPQSECAVEPGSEQKCSTSFPGGNLVDGLPPALNDGLSFWLRVRFLAIRIGLKVLCATLRVLLECPKHPGVLEKFVVRNARSFKLLKMGAHGGCHGQGGAQTSRSSHSNDTKMLRISALIFAVSVTETCFFSLGPRSGLLKKAFLITRRAFSL